VNFVRGRDRVIEGQRQLLEAALGGYGILDIKIMDICMKCTWVRRWLIEQRYTDYPMLQALGGRDINVNQIGLDTADIIGKPVIEYIVKCWIRFAGEFYSAGNNIWRARVFENQVIRGEGNDNIEISIFGRRRYNIMREQLKDARLEDLMDEEGETLDLVVINRKFGTNINWAEYFRMRTMLVEIREGFLIAPDSEDAQDLGDYVCTVVGKEDAENTGSSWWDKGQNSTGIIIQWK